MKRVLMQWGEIYRAFVQERFDQFSRGGGGWPRLAESTKRQRRKPSRPRSRSARRFSILRDTNLMFMALSPTFRSLPGQFQQANRLSVEVGYGGAGYHREARMTVARLASIHDSGEGPFLPRREIIVQPPQRTVQLMADKANEGLRKAAVEQEVD